MRILVVGGGGREHTLVWKLAQSRHTPELFCAPGNAGTASLATNLSIAADDVEQLSQWCACEKPDLVVVGPEAPLCAGLADRLRRQGVRVFGPGADGARLEGSKAFAKEIMREAGVPTAEAWAFSDANEALAFLANQEDQPWVVKADGLAAGKGVTVCTGRAEANAAVREALEDNRFGDAGARVLIEECLVGEEISVLALIDGHRSVLLPSSQDHKRALDGDKGPNTGGMGAYSPAPVLSDAQWAGLQDLVFAPVLAELARRNIDFCGVLYAGLMVTDAGPKVLEFNTRFGDPETQCVLPRLVCDLVDVLQACVDGALNESMLQVANDACACVVMASEGYPSAYEPGRVVSGLDAVASRNNVVVFHAGTDQADDRVVTSGGRVFGVTGWGSDLAAALQQAYTAISDIHFDGAQYRRDIGAKALAGSAGTM